MDSTIEQGELVQQYKKVQRQLKRLITTVFPDKQIKYLVDYALVQSDDRSVEYVEYVLYHYTYLMHVSALRQKYADLYGTDKPHKFAIDVFAYLAKDAKQFYDTIHCSTMPDIEESIDDNRIIDGEDYVPSKVLDIPQKSSKNRRKKMKRLQQTEEELFEEMAAYNRKRALTFTDIWGSLPVACDALNVKRTEFSTIIKNYLYEMSQTKMHKGWSDKKRNTFTYGVFAYTALHGDLSTMESYDPGTINMILYKYLTAFYNMFKDKSRNPVEFDLAPKYTHKDATVSLCVSIYPCGYRVNLPKYVLLSTGFMQMCMFMDRTIIIGNEEEEMEVHVCLKCKNPTCGSNRQQNKYHIYTMWTKQHTCKRCDGTTVYPNKLCLVCDLMDIKVTPTKNIIPVYLVGLVLDLGPKKAKKLLNY